MRRTVLLFALLAACENDSGGGGGPSCSRTCEITTPTCGAYVNACGELVDCGMCTFQTTTAPGTLQFAAEVTGSRAPDGTIEIAYSTSDGIVLARWNGTTWTSETAVTGTSLSSGELRIAPDGTRWMTYTESGSSRMVRAAPGGAWEDVTPPASGDEVVSLAIASDGTLWAALEGSDGVSVARWDGSSWSRETVSTASISQRGAAIAIAGSEPVVAFATNTEGLVLAERSGGTWSTTVLAEDDAAAAIAIGPDGQPVVVTADDRENLLIYRRSGGEWTATTAPETGSFQSSSRPSVAVDGRGTIWITAGEYDVFLVNVTSVATTLQRIHRSCWTGAIVVPGSGDDVVLVDACGDTLEAHVRDAIVPAEYAADCAEATEAICAQACEGCGYGRCCWSWESGSTCLAAFSTGPARCEQRVRMHLCGAIENDATALVACREAAPATACGPEEAVLPEPCSALY